jgi:hypothetical protein
MNEIAERIMHLPTAARRLAAVEYWLATECPSVEAVIALLLQIAQLEQQGDEA